MDNLIKKLGITPDITAYMLHAPENYTALVPQAVGVPEVSKLPNEVGWLQAFYMEKTELEHEIVALKEHLQKTGQLWLCWPKKSSGVTANLSDNIVRTIGLQAGLVDVKVAAIDDTWSALKFVYRLSNR